MSPTTRGQIPNRSYNPTVSSGPVTDDGTGPRLNRVGSIVLSHQGREVPYLWPSSSENRTEDESLRVAGPTPVNESWREPREMSTPVVTRGRSRGRWQVVRGPARPTSPTSAAVVETDASGGVEEVDETVEVLRPPREVGVLGPVVAGQRSPSTRVGSWVLGWRCFQSVDVCRAPTFGTRERTSSD